MARGQSVVIPSDRGISSDISLTLSVLQASKS